MATQATNTTGKRALSGQESLDFELLYLLETEPHLSQRDIAERLDISLGRVNYCLKSLMESGAVKLGRVRATDDRPRHAYLPTTQGIARRTALTGAFLQLKRAQYERIRRQIESLGGSRAEGEEGGEPPP